MSEIKVHRRNPLEAILMLNFSKNSVAMWFLWWLRMVNGERILFLEERPKKEKRESYGRPQGEASLKVVETLSFMRLKRLL